jgi:hypothetical protein
VHRIVKLVLVLAICVPLSACGSSSSTTTTTPSSPSAPRAKLIAMRSAARSQQSVHYVSESSAPGHKIEIVADAGETEGTQQVTITDHSQTGHVTTLVSGDAAYLRGDAFGMRAYFGFTKAQATKYAGKWISVPSSNPGYATISGDLTFPSFVSHLFPPMTNLSLVPRGSLTGVRGTVHGQAGVTVTATVFAPAHGKPLPAKQTATSSGHLGHLGAGVVTMSDWNEPVHVSAPANAVPITSIKTVVGG